MTKSNAIHVYILLFYTLLLNAIIIRLPTIFASFSLELDISRIFQRFTFF